MIIYTLTIRQLKQTAKVPVTKPVITITFLLNLMTPRLKQTAKEPVTATWH